MSPPNLDAAGELLAALRAGQRRALARALTLAESQDLGQRATLDALWQLAGTPPDTTLRVAFTGPPGAGKSSLIERVGLALISSGKRLAVLPIDPSSPVSGGSLLADQTRMVELSRQPHAFIRPSAAGSMLGGLAAHTHESVELCELAGYDCIILETVGTGQNEIDVAATADLVLQVLTADAGDELQAMKRGINEVTHALVVNKADGERAALAQDIGRAYASAAYLWGNALPVFVTSARDGLGVDGLVAWIVEHAQSWNAADAQRQTRRRAQRLNQFDRALQQALLPRLLQVNDVRHHYELVRADLDAGATSVPGALARFFAQLELGAN